MGRDEINPLLFKTISKVFSVPLAIIFQESISSGTIPKIWMDARETPLFKKVRNLIQANIALLASHQSFVSVKRQLLLGLRYLNI